MYDGLIGDEMTEYEKYPQKKAKPEKLRVAAYCRVSTDSEDQANSFESQQRYFRQYIESRPDWELFAIFADDGLSGTSIKKRKAFQRMLTCALKGEFDLLLTKEISRFARNTLDSIYYTRELKRKGVGVLFMNDGINTLEPDAELRLTIMASIAQEESRRTSQRVKWGQKRRMEEGVVFGRSMLGYDVKEGKMTVNEEGAGVVRLIFHKFAEEGKGTHVIARELSEEGFLPMYAREWSSSVILRMLRNEKYCGDLIQKKTYTPDYLSHAKKYNKGAEEFVILRNHHEPIISRELFEKANCLLKEKAAFSGNKSRYSARHPLSGKIKCGCCGANYVARYRKRKDGSICRTWRCMEAVKHGRPHKDKNGQMRGCGNISIRGGEAVGLVAFVCRQITGNDMRVRKKLSEAIRPVIPANKREYLIREFYALLENPEEKEIFYAELLDNMTVYDSENIHVLLKGIPCAFHCERKRAEGS